MRNGFYELAELYNAAHMEQLCVMTCDKIMLMFGTGKYVDKAIDLKVQYAPLQTIRWIWWKIRINMRPD